MYGSFVGGALLRAWSDGTIEMKKIATFGTSSGEACGSSTPCTSQWFVISSPTVGYRAHADLDADEAVGAADLAILHSSWGDAPRVSAPAPPRRGLDVRTRRCALSTSASRSPSGSRGMALHRRRVRRAAATHGWQTARSGDRTPMRSDALAQALGAYPRAALSRPRPSPWPTRLPLSCRP
jgi:hypothetical protein